MRAGAHFQPLGDAQELAVVQRFQAGQFGAVLLQQVGQLQQQPFTAGGQHVVPGARGERAARGLHRQIHLHGAGIRLMRDDLPGGRVVDGDRLALPLVHRLAVDQHEFPDRAQFRAVGPCRARGRNAWERHLKLQRKVWEPE
ncbi:hypothetical protein D3C71_1697800 [compost metagenome]